MNMEKLKDLIQYGWDWTEENKKSFPEDSQELFSDKADEFMEFLLSRIVGNDTYLKALDDMRTDEVLKAIEDADSMLDLVKKLAKLTEDGKAEIKIVRVK